MKRNIRLLTGILAVALFGATGSFSAYNSIQDNIEYKAERVSQRSVVDPSVILDDRYFTMASGSDGYGSFEGNIFNWHNPQTKFDPNGAVDVTLSFNFTNDFINNFSDNKYIWFLGENGKKAPSGDEDKTPNTQAKKISGVYLTYTKTTTIGSEDGEQFIEFSSPINISSSGGVATSENMKNTFSLNYTLDGDAIYKLNDVYVGIVSKAGTPFYARMANPVAGDALYAETQDGEEVNTFDPSFTPEKIKASYELEKASIKDSVTTDLLPKTPQISEDSSVNKFTVNQENRENIVFSINLDEGSNSQAWIDAVGQDYSYNEKSIDMSAKKIVAKNSKSFLDKPEPNTVNLEFEDLTLEDKTPDANINTPSDGTIRHTYSITGIGSSKAPLEPGASFNDLEIQFFDGKNPYGELKTQFETYLTNYQNDLFTDWVNTVYGSLDNAINTYNLLSGSTVTTSSINDELNTEFYNKSEEVVKDAHNNYDDVFVKSSKNGPLFSTKSYDNPMVYFSFTFNDISPTSAEFSFTSLQNEDSSPTPSTPWFDEFEGKDIHLFSDANQDGVFSFDEELNITYEQEKDQDGFLNTTPTMTRYYIVDGLEPNTDYNISTGDETTSSLAMYLASENSTWKQMGWDDELNRKGVNGFIPGFAANNGIIGSKYEDDGVYYNDDRFYYIDNALYTPHSIKFYIAISLILLLIIILIIFLVLIGKGITAYRQYFAMGLYFDGQESFKSGELVMNWVHVNKHKKFWAAHEDNLRLFANGREISAIFRRDDEVEKGYRIIVVEDSNDKRAVLSLMAASKFNKFQIGLKNDEPEKVNVIKDAKAAKISKKLAKRGSGVSYEETRNAALKNIKEQYGKEVLKGIDKKLVSLINRSKSTQTSMRYQVLFPEAHPLVKKFDPHSKNIGFFHIYNGKAYKLEYRFIGKYGSLFEFDLIGLDPGTIYVGLSVTIDGGKTVIPSSALYGITKDENDVVPSKSAAKLGKPKKGAKGVAIWPKEQGYEYIGKEATDRTFDIMVKKHYEDEHPEFTLSADRAYEYYEDYIDVWMKSAKKSSTIAVDLTRSDTLAKAETIMTDEKTAREIAQKAKQGKTGETKLKKPIKKKGI